MISIKTVALYVTDQNRARDFYVDVMGFEVRGDNDMGLMGRWLEVAPPGSATGFVLADAAKFEKTDRVGGSADVTLGTDDVVGMHDRIAAAGGSVTDVQTEDWGTFFQVTDPDGHQFVITE
jgi:predicted enzyme related to lactoylglutathione lyase